VENIAKFTGEREPITRSPPSKTSTASASPNGDYYGIG
jgi:hypothetical protein